VALPSPPLVPKPVQDFFLARPRSPRRSHGSGERLSGLARGPLMCLESHRVIYHFSDRWLAGMFPAHGQYAPRWDAQGGRRGVVFTSLPRADRGEPLSGSLRLNRGASGASRTPN